MPVWEDAPIVTMQGATPDQFGQWPVGGEPVGPRRAKDIGDAIIAGLQNSATGLALRGELPDMQLDPKAPWYQRVTAGAAGVVADIPLSVAGAIGGGVAGTAVAPGVGSAVGAGAGAFAAPMALRDALIEAYNSNHALSWEGAWEIAKAALKGGAKGAVIGGVTAGAGKFVAPVIEEATKGAVAAGSLTEAGAARVVSAGQAGTELAALTATASALEGRMPTWQDFMDNAVLLGGLKGATTVAKALRNIYAETGKLPDEVLAEARKNPKLHEQLLKGEDLPPDYADLALSERIKAAIDADPRPEMIREVMTTDAQSNTPKIDGKLLADPVKYEYISDSATAAGVLRAVTELYEKEILRQTRGVVPNKQTAIDGLKMVTDGVIGEHVVGKAANAAEIWARAHLLRGATQHAVQSLRELADVPPEQVTPIAKMKALAAIERVSMLKAEIEGVGAEAGRALQIFRGIKRNPALLGEADTLLRLAERKGNLQDLGRLVDSIKDPAQFAEFARAYTKATTGEMALEAWKASILSGPQTLLANLMGNVTKWVFEVPETAFAATLTAIQRAAQGDPLKMAQYKARALAPLIGLQLGAKDAFMVAAEVLRQEGAHLEKADVYRTAIPGRTGHFIRTPFRLLQATDVLFRTPAERAKAYELAVDRVVKEGLHPDSAEGRAKIVEYTNRPEVGLGEKAGQDAIAAVQNAGAEAVFAQRLGPRMEIIQRAMAGHWSQLVVPFFRTPANLVSWAVQHTPGLNLMSGRWREDFAAGGERRNQAIARVVLGGAISLTAYEMAKEGLLTGGGMFDPEQRRTKAAAGWQPYSLKIGDKYYSYQRLEPVAKVLGIAADIVDLIEASRDEEDKAKLVSMLVLMFGNATISTTYLSGLANAVQSLADPERYGENFLEQYASSLVPKVVGQTTTLFDPYKRDIDSVADAIQSQLPFLREKLLPKRDVWGEPTKNGHWFDVMPVATSEQSHNKVKTEAQRLQVAIADAPRFVLERGPFKPRDRRIELTPEQRDIFRQVSGKQAMTILAPIVNAPDWAQIPDFAKAEIYKRVIEGARKQGRYAALPPDAAARQKLRDELVDEIIRQTNAAGADVK